MEKAWSLALWSVLVCYNTGYRVGKLKGLPSRQKGIMSMARYHYTRENENGVVLYLESEPAEDAMDEFDDEIAVGFSGNGYLSFCRRPHRIRVDGQGARFACRRARDACRAAMARTMARSRVDTCLGRVKCCFSHALIFAAQVCAIYVVILLSGLLVFWSAIFIDSKGRKFSRQEDSRILRKHHREIGKTMAINRVTIMGNLTRDAELRKKGDATSVLTFGLAINEKKKDSETGEYVDAPVFVDCALFGARAEALAPYLTKGKKVSVDGRLRYHSWMKNEEKRHALSVLVTDIEFADSKGAGKDTVSAQGQSTEPETYDADIPF